MCNTIAGIMHKVDLDTEKLKELRKSRGLKLAQVADNTGLTVSALSNYENGHSTPPGDVLLRLLDFYRVTNHEVTKNISLPV
jgi:transcriptional regulator with XRE-family HTH domain